MKQAFAKQLRYNKPLTQQMVDGLLSPTFYNGEKKSVGDVVLHAFLITKNENEETVISLTSLKESHFNLFVLGDTTNKPRITSLPLIQLK